MVTGSSDHDAVALRTAVTSCAAVISGPEGILIGVRCPVIPTLRFVPPTSTTRIVACPYSYPFLKNT
jgi:hypothetical protein